jgi:hypothetical protein
MKPANVRVIRFVRPGYKAFIEAFEKCKYKYNLSCDADHYFYPHAFEAYYETAIKNPEKGRIRSKMKSPWFNEMVPGPNLYSMELYYQIRPKFTDTLQCDAELSKLPEMYLPENGILVGTDMAYTDHMQMFNTFKRRMERLKIRKKYNDYRLWIGHFSKTYSTTWDDLYLFALLGMMVGMMNIGFNADLNKANDFSDYDNDIFKALLRAFGVKNEARELTEVDFEFSKAPSIKAGYDEIQDSNIIRNLSSVFNKSSSIEIIKRNLTEIRSVIFDVMKRKIKKITTT